MSESGASTIKSATRVFEVLELFERIREPLTSIRVGRSLNYPASSALALLKSMVASGYLSFDRTDLTYFPTVRLTMLGQWVEGAVHLGDSNLSTLVDAVIQATGESISISCQNDLDMQFVHIAQGPQHITVNLKPGTLAPLFHSTIGLTSLSLRSDREVERLVERRNRESKTPATRVNLAKALKIIEGVRRRGYLAGYDMYIEGVGAIAWVLPTRDGRRSMVLAVSGPSERLRRNEAAIVGAVGQVLAHHGFVGQPQAQKSA